MPRRADPRVVWLVIALAAVSERAASAQQAPVPATSDAQRPADGLRTFTIEKPVMAVSPAPLRTRATASKLPRAHDALRATLGVGYVQGADWGADILAAGGVAGTQVVLNALVTKGGQGFALDHGGVSIFDPEAHWRAEAGDLFSPLRGASRGLRFSIPTSNPLRHRAIAVYGPRRSSGEHGTVVSYRDQIEIGRQTLLDAEVASDKSFVLRNRLVLPRVDLEAFYRSAGKRAARDATLSAGVRLWRGVTMNGAIYRDLASADRSAWRNIGVRLPLTHYFDLTLERTYVDTRDSSQTLSAAMGSLVAGQLRAPLGFLLEVILATAAALHVGLRAIDDPARAFGAADAGQAG